MQTELENRKHDEAGRYTSDKQVSYHLIGYLHIEKEQEVNCRRQDN
jgi:hypothetical protein